MGPSRSQLGVVAAGHPISAETGAGALRDGGNAVDAAVAAMLASLTCEPLLTGLGAGGYLLAVPPGGAPTLLDFFVEAPGRGLGDSPGPAAEMISVPVSFGDAVQEFHIGVASAGTYGLPAGVCEAARRFCRLPLERLAAPAAVLAREGVALNAQQAYVVEILEGTVTSTPEAAELFAPGGSVLRPGDVLRQPELADALERLGAEGSSPFYEGDIARAVADWVQARGGLLGGADLAAYEVIERPPLRVAYRDREVAINPPPSAGGILIAHALALLDPIVGTPGVTALVDAMERTQKERTPEFLAGLGDPEFVRALVGRVGGRLGSTTHIATLDREGWACSVTCSNGSASGVIVPGTGVHLNNMLGEQDLNPLGFHRHSPGRRLPSMMAPAVVLRRGVAELAVGSAGSNRIRSAILQTIVRCIDDGMEAQAAVQAPRVHFENGIVFAEPGIDVGALEDAGWR
ncbi:MAG: gamma-glutamyltransferase family protein, partial [Solirubrobacteraceae bacterium]